MGKHSRRAPYRRHHHHVKAALVGLILVGELAAVGVRGTFALMTSQTSNVASSAAAGTMTLSTSSGSSTCRSWTGTGEPVLNDNANCGTLFSVGPYYPGQSTSVDVAVTNNGSLPGNLSVYSPEDVYGNDCLPTSPGICDAVEMTVQETQSNDTTPVACFYPESGTTCSFEPLTTLGSTFCPTTSPSPALGTLTDFTYCAYFDFADRLELGPIAAGATRYFVLSFELPTFRSPSTANQYQGQAATFSLGWVLAEAYAP